ncbi:MAG: hypothetical protein AAF616_02970 [Bacteroidota bacterium]
MSAEKTNAAKFKALIALARADGEIDMHEKIFIDYLAERQDLSMKELKEYVNSTHKFSDLADELDEDDKVEILVHLVKLMKADGKILDSETSYCEKIARDCGYRPNSIGFLSGAVNDNPRIDPNFTYIKQGLKKYKLAQLYTTVPS